MEKITIEMIRNELAEIERRLKPSPERLKEIYEEINKKTAEMQVAFLDGNNEKSKKLAREIAKLQEEKDVAKSVDWTANSGHLKDAVIRNSKLGRMCKEFETQQLEQMNSKILEREAIAEKINATVTELFESMKTLRKMHEEMAAIGTELNFTRKYTPDPAEIINGCYYETSRQKMTRIDWGYIAATIKRIAGIH